MSPFIGFFSTRVLKNDVDAL